MRWREVIYDIHTSLNQQYDDADISLVQTSYWCSVAANRLLSQHIDKRDSGAFVAAYYNLQVLIDTTNDYKYFVLPENIFDFDKDDGVEYLSYSSTTDDCLPMFTGVKFTRTSAAAAERLYWTEEEKPSPSNPYFYRLKDKIYLLGLESITSPPLEGGFYQTIPAYVIDLDDEFPFPDELITVLQRYTFDFGRFVLSLPKDNTNDGASGQQVTQLPKMNEVQNDINNE